jgi:hypothetical protein
MTINFLEHRKQDEGAEVLHRKQFIERMERKLEFKQSLKHPYYQRYLIR